MMIKPNSFSFETALKGDTRLLYTVPKASTIEFPCFELSRLSELFSVCKELGLSYSLHYPSYYSYNKVGFNESDDFRIILSNIQEYYTAFDDISSFVCHFPFHSFTATTISSHVLFDIVKALSDMTNSKTPFLIENTSIVTNCSSAAQYKYYLYDTSLQFCLDVGHAHLVNAEEPFNFIRLLGDRILAIHYYNTPNKQHDKIGYHYYDNVSFINDPRFIDIPLLSAYLNNLKNLVWIVDESFDRDQYT